MPAGAHTSSAAMKLLGLLNDHDSSSCSLEVVLVSVARQLTVADVRELAVAVNGSR